jgi:PAS domain S-box-containing protein
VPVIIQIGQEAVNSMTPSEGRLKPDISEYLDLAVQNSDDLRQAEQALGERERQLDSLLALLPGSAYRALADEHWTALFVSKGIEESTGYAPDEFTSRRLSYNDIMLSEDRPATREAVLAALGERAMYNVEHRIRHKDGSLRWIWSRGHGVFAPDGSLRFIEGWQLDVTHRKQAEEKLRESEQRWRGLTEALPQLVWSATPDGACDYFSTQWTEHTGVSEADLLGWRWLLTLHPDDREPTRRLWTDSVAGRQPYDVEYRIRRRDGEYRWFKTRGTPIRDTEGKIVKWFGTCTDITDLRQTQEALRASEARYRVIVEHAADAFCLHAEDTRVLDVNRRTCESLGYTREELIGMMPSEFDPDVTPAVEEQIKRQLSAGETIALESRHRRKDGTIFPVEVRGKAFWEAGRLFSVTMARDITERKRAEEALRASEERFRGTFENAAVGIAHRDATGRFLRVNEKLCDILGYTREEMLHKTVRDITHRDDLAASIDAITALWQGESQTLRLEKRYVRKDGSLVWGELFGSLQRDAAGKPAYDISIVNDISERKRLEDELRASEERRGLILDNAHDAFVAMSAEGLITEWNHQAEITFGWPRAEAVGRILSETIIPPQFREAHTRGLARFLATGEGPVLNRVLEVLALRRDGREFPAEISIAPVRLGEQYLFVAFIRDVTERKQAEEELRRAKEAAEAANRAKDEFLANVSHEIRTPMNAILGMTDLALDTPLTEDQRHYLTTVKSAADALLAVINDILDFAKIEAGRLELDPTDFSLSSVLDATLRALALRAHKKGLELVCQQRPGVPDALIGDVGRLRQVLINLVANAIKFTARGEIVVLVENAGELAPEGEISLRFAVTDTGIGIPPEKQARIFQAFEQEDTSTTRKYGGTGLGLTIASRLVALMGGGIVVDSVPGQGSTFAFTARFRLQPHPPETITASPPVVLRDVPVLIVDDNATNRHILEKWLRGYSMEPTAAGDGVTAMDALWHGVAQGRPYPLMLLDGRMPDIDGLALAAKISQQAELSFTRIILLSSGDRSGNLTRARQLGISANLLKPLQQRELMETILRVMGHEGDLEGLLISPPVVRPPIPECVVGAPLRILAAEDNEFNRDLLEHLLARQGLSAAMAVNGRETLALLEREPFDLLLLDIHMPELDGFQVVGTIRERERTAGGHLPVIALTARSRQGDRERCLGAGMDEYLVKPFNAADLWAAIDRVVGSCPPRKPPRLDLLDPPVLLAACGSDPAMLRKMCRLLQSRVPEHLAAIRHALHDQDALRLREAAHRFCGMLSAFSTVAGDQAADLEDLAARRLLPEALPIVEQLDRRATELARLAGGLTIETLRKQAEPADDPTRAAGT